MREISKFKMTFLKKKKNLNMIDSHFTKIFPKINFKNKI